MQSERTETAGTAAADAQLPGHDFDSRDLVWYIDKLVQVLVFIGGASAMVITPDESWAGAWLSALSRTTWSTASAG